MVSDIVVDVVVGVAISLILVVEVLDAIEVLESHSAQRLLDTHTVIIHRLLHDVNVRACRGRLAEQYRDAVINLLGTPGSLCLAPSSKPAHLRRTKQLNITN